MESCLFKRNRNKTKKREIVWKIKKKVVYLWKQKQNKLYGKNN
jgi:hypothetical protein